MPDNLAGVRKPALFSIPFRHRFLRRSGAGVSPDEEQRVERALATARVIVALCSLVAVHIDPTEPKQFEQDAYIVLMGYTVWSILVSAGLRWARDVNPHFVQLIHSIDLIGPSLLCLFTDGADSPFFTLYLFAVLAAAFRWGFWETAATSGASVALLAAQALLLVKGPPAWRELEVGVLELNKVIIRCVYLLLAGLMIGYMAEGEKELRAENAAINRMLGRARVDSGLSGSMAGIGAELAAIFHAAIIYVVARDINTSRAFLWRLPPDPPEGRSHAHELSLAEQLSYLPPDAPSAFVASVPGERQAGVLLAAVDRDGDVLKTDRINSPEIRIPGAKTLISVDFRFGQDWEGRVILVDPWVRGNPDSELRFVQSIVRQVGPALHSVYLVRRLRTRAGAMERARVARELHDGAIQSLISIEMQIDVLRRRSSGEQAPLAAELARVQYLLQQEVVNLRELMQQMRPVDMGPQQFLDYLADAVDRFRRDTGIAARFITDLQEVALSPSACRELARVVQEALVNVRKHSGARTAMVRFLSRDGQWVLTIDDDGKGFDFAGRRDLDQLDGMRRGPTTIKERVRTIGGNLVIDSKPGEGARLEITVPKKGHSAYGQ